MEELKPDKCDCCGRPLDEQYKKTGIFKEYKELKDIPEIIKVGKDCGYCVVPYGSMTRDIDLLAVPWVEESVSPEELIKAICNINMYRLFKEPHQTITQKPHGRVSQVISVAGVNTYIDLTICPRIPPATASITRTDIAFMVQEIISEAHTRKKGSNMIDLIDRYEKEFCSKSPATASKSVDVGKLAKFLFYRDNPDLDSVKDHHPECRWENCAPEDRASYNCLATVIKEAIERNEV